MQQQTAESARTAAHVLFQPQTPVSLADSYLTVDIALPLPKLLNMDLRPIYKFSSILQQLEQKRWKNPQFCNNPEINALLQHHFDGIISSIQIEYERAEKERTKLVKELASFVNQTITLQRQRRSPLLFAMGAATAITLEPLLEKTGCTLNFWSVRKIEAKDRTIGRMVAFFGIKNGSPAQRRKKLYSGHGQQ